MTLEIQGTKLQRPEDLGLANPKTVPLAPSLALGVGLHVDSLWAGPSAKACMHAWPCASDITGLGPGITPEPLLSSLWFCSCSVLTGTGRPLPQGSGSLLLALLPPQEVLSSDILQ